MKKSLTGLLCAAVVAIATLAAPPAPAESDRAQGGHAAAAPGPRIVAITHNIGGEIAYAAQGKPPAQAIQAVSAMITNNSPDVVALQEVCASQGSAFYDANSPKGYWAWFQPLKHKDACGAGTDLNHGNLLAVRVVSGTSFARPVSDPIRWQHRPWHALRRLHQGRQVDPGVQHPPHRRIGPPGRQQETQPGTADQGLVELLDVIRLRGRDRGGLQLGSHVGRDPSVNHLGGGVGPFIEADQGSPPKPTKRQYTTSCNADWNQKLDYMFFSYNLTGRNYVSSSVNGNGTCSDHRALLGVAN